jgi:hypothetical protein
MKTALNSLPPAKSPEEEIDGREMKTTAKSLPPKKSPEEEAEIDRLLGDRALFDVTDPQKFGGPSPPVIFRARRAGMIETVPSGGRTKLSRATMKGLLLKGLGRVDFYYPNSKPKVPRAPENLKPSTKPRQTTSGSISD